MGNINKFAVVFHVFMILALLPFVACDKVGNDIVSEGDFVNIMLDIDQLTLESASIRVRHDGALDLNWVYMNTQDLESDAAELINNKVAKELELKQAPTLVVYKNGVAEKFAGVAAVKSFIDSNK